MLTGGDSLGFDDTTKRQFSDVFKPIICAVNGFCIAGGMEMLLGTDLRIAAEHATFGLGEVRWGLVPLGGTHIRLAAPDPLGHVDAAPAHRQADQRPARLRGRG